ncbi:Ig-like domain-containing protein [Nitratireductor basaltis]|uniref:Flagellar hook capping protein n=1 Tax=Nitratireductor basaltis TaxID=472175 RepID=A0A084U6M5_9HYPH|nr:Ig-like domain-containing protein [Nitratireductor basaltis]KFB08611.1 Flagellar hook capping protein [Nitratireductor basaltis]
MDIRAQFISSDHALAQEVLFQGSAPTLDARAISKIRLDASSSQIANYRRVGDDLVIELLDGEQIILAGWFEEDGDERGELQIMHEDASCYVAVSFADEYPGLLQPQVSTGACSNADFGGGAGLGGALGGIAGPLVIGGLVAAGAVGLALALDDDDDNGGGNGGGGQPGIKPVVNPTNGKEASGTAKPGTIIEMDRDGDGIPDASAVAGDDGKWVIPIDPPAEHGDELEFVGRDPETGNPSDPVREVVDALAPDAPKVNPTNGKELSGEGEPGSTVIVDDNGDGIPDHTAVVGDDGKWVIPLDPPLEDGRELEVSLKDPAGNESEKVPVVVDGEAPDLPQVNPTDGRELSGTGEPGATIIIDDKRDGTPDHSVIVGDDGNWSIPFDPPLGDGSELDVSQKDPAGNESGKVPIVVDAQLPDAPEVSDIIEEDTGTVGDNITSDTTPTIRGTSTEEDGTVVKIYLDGREVGSTTVQGGEWHYTSDELSDGDYELTATQLSPRGTESQASAPLAFTIDTNEGGTVPTEPPVITGIDTDGGIDPEDGITNDPTLFFEGTADRLATVWVYLDGVLLGSVQADNDGAWRYDHTGTVLADGTYELTAEQQDAAGNAKSAMSAPFEVVVDTNGAGEGTPVPAEPPTVTGILDDNGASGSDGITNDTTLHFLGEAEPHALVTVMLDGVVIGSEIAGADGVWHLDHSETSLADGTYQVTATQQDAAGNPVSAPSDPFTVVVDTNGGGEGGETPSPAPVVTGIEVDGGLDPADGITDETMLFFLGTAKPHALVTVLLDGVELGTATADETGAWRYDHTGTVLADGTYQVTATQQDAAGNPPSPVSDPYRVIVDTNEGGTVPTEPPVITGFEEDSGVVGDGITNDNMIAFTGTSTETDGTVVTVTLLDEGGATVATLTATVANGTWTTNESAELPDGNYTATATQQDAAGNPPSAASEATSLTIDTNDGGADVTPPPVILAIADDNGRENDDGITNDNTIQILGTSDEPDGAVVTVTIRDSANAVVATLTATVFEGRWSTEPTAALADGGYTISATQQDAAGNDPSAPSNLFDMVIDTNNGGADATPPPVVTHIDPDSGFDPTDGITQDQHLVFHGTGEAGATVWLYIDGDEIGSNIVDENGEWFIDNTENALGQGTYQITARQQDAAGNDISGYSDAYQVTVDTDAPSVSIRAMSNDFGVVGDFITHAEETRLSGTTDPNIRIDVFVEGVNIGSMISDANGYWESEIIDLSALGVGDTLNVTVRARNAAGITATAEQVVERHNHEIPLSVLNPDSGFVVVGDRTNDFAGSVRLVGDVNDDGIGDFIVGANGGDDYTTNAGEVYLIYGKTNGDYGSLVDGRRMVDLGSLAPEDGLVIQGPWTRFHLLTGASLGGDFNNDGIADLLLQGRGESNLSNAGGAFVLFGRADGQWGDVEGGRQVLKLAGLTAEYGVRIRNTSNPVLENSSFQISSAGDFDGDGIEDFLVSTPWSNYPSTTGRSYLIYGREDGAWGNANGSGRLLDLSSIPTGQGVAFVGTKKQGLIGLHIDSGDFNGDGLTDLLISQQREYTGSGSSNDAPGRAYIVFGDAERSLGTSMNLEAMTHDQGVMFYRTGSISLGHVLASVGDLNKDGLDDLAVGGNANGSAGETTILYGKAGTDWTETTGRQSLNLATIGPDDGFTIKYDPELSNPTLVTHGDINGDGHDDLLISTLGGGYHANSGLITVVFGKSDGVWGEVVGGKRILDITELTAEEGVSFHGENVADGLQRVDASGDMNGDGVNDIIIGSNNNDLGGTDAGASYIIYGQTNGFGAGLIRNGSGADDWMSGSDKNDQLNGMGGNDTLLGYEGDDILTVANAGFLMVDGGAGEDTMVISAGGIHLDLTAFNQDAVKGIEMVDLSGSGANRMTVTEQDVLDMSDAGLVKLRGDIDDSATASGFTDSGADQTENGITYDVYTSGGATLWIDQQMSVTV